jgi:hypothetical protein
MKILPATPGKTLLVDSDLVRIHKAVQMGIDATICMSTWCLK